MNKVLSVSDLRVQFKKDEQIIQAVRGVSFDLAPGERLGIVGESGCGKSVTVRSIIKLINSHSASIPSGSILFEGQDLLQLTEAQLRKIRGKEIGFIFQDPMNSLNPTMSIGKQIMEGYLLHHKEISHQQATVYAQELLELVGLSGSYMSRFPHELSGGQRQRVMIACAIAPKPKILIADEATTALDVTVAKQILDLLKTIQKQRQMSVIFITHDLHIATDFCDRILVMYAGKVVESATSEALFKNPKHPYTQGLIGAIPKLEERKTEKLKPIPGSPPLLSSPPNGCAFHARCPHAMRICKEQQPPNFLVASTSFTACWLEDERAKK